MSNNATENQQQRGCKYLTRVAISRKELNSSICTCHGVVIEIDLLAAVCTTPSSVAEANVLTDANTVSAAVVGALESVLSTKVVEIRTYDSVIRIPYVEQLASLLCRAGEDVSTDLNLESTVGTLKLRNSYLNLMTFCVEVSRLVSVVQASGVASVSFRAVLLESVWKKA